MGNAFKMTFTAVREGNSHEVTGVQMCVQREEERWISRLLSAGEFAELMLASHVFPPSDADKLFSRVHEQGQITYENVSLDDSKLQFLGLNSIRPQ